MPRVSEIERTKRDLTIVQERLSGLTYRELAENHDLSKAAIHLILNRDEIKEIVEQGTNEMVCLIPRAIDNLVKYLDPAFKDKKIQWDASKTVLQNTGILASHTGGNTYIQNIFNSNALPSNEEVTRFTELVQLRQDTDIQDAEYTEEMSSLDDDN